jgi:DNA-binding GntR family transcriptional regulator
LAKQSRRVEQLARGVNESLHELATRHLREMIVKNELGPGARLHEQTLSETLGISRTPVREAIRALAAEGLVEVLSNKGAVVREMTVNEVLDTFHVIGALDSLVGELAIANMTPQDLGDLEDMHDRMRSRFESKDLFGYFKANQDIHRKLVTMSGNVTLQRQLQALNAQVQPFRYSVNIDRESWERSVRDHEAIMNALRDRDPGALARLLRQHLPNKTDVVRHAFASASALKRPRTVRRRNSSMVDGGE